MYTLRRSTRRDAVIRTWGTSPALRLTTAVLKEAGLQLDERVDLVVSKGQVIIRVIDKVEYDLETLVDGINAKNTHDEVSFGAPVGKEAL